MLRLDLTAGPRWIDIMPGVRFEVLPFTTALMLEAQAELRAARDAEGGDGDASMSARQQVDFAKAIATRAVIGWEGVVGAAGKPMPVTPEGIVAALDQVPVFTAFQAGYVNAGLMQADEGNVSAPSPIGNTAAARPTAKSVPKSAQSARAAKTAR